MTRYLSAIIVISIFLSFFRLPSVTLFDVDEAVFAQATREMVEGHDWITPTYNGENRYDKPILFYWLMAISYKSFGINEFAARFPSALTGCLLVMAVFFFVRHVRDERSAFWAAVSLSASIFFLLYSHAAVTDMTLTLFITLALFSFRLSRRLDRRFLYGVYLFSACAFLTKGLIGIVFPFGIIVTYVLLAEGSGGLKRVFSFGGIILFMIISMPWYLIQLRINGSEFIEQFFMKHHFRRYTGVISGHRGSPLYYLPVLIAGLFPWVAFLPGGVRDALGAFKSLRDKRKQSAPHEGDDILFFALVWFSFIFLFFSFSTTKLPNYILPLVPAASVLISAGMGGMERWLRYPYLVIALTACVCGTGFLFAKHFLAPLGISDLTWAHYLAAAMFVMALTAVYISFSAKERHAYLAGLMIIFLMIIAMKALPVASQYLQGTLHRYSLLARDRLNANERLIAYQMNNPSLVFYSGHRVWKVGPKEELTVFMEGRGHAVVITKARNIRDFTHAGFSLIEEDGRYALLERK